MPRRNKRRMYKRKRISKLSLYKKRFGVNDLVYMPCKAIITSIGSSTGAVNLYMNLDEPLRTSSDFTHRLGSFKKYFVKSIMVQWKPNNVNTKGTLFFGYNPNVVGTAPNSGITIIDLKDHVVSNVGKECTLFSSNVSMSGINQTLIDINSPLSGSIQWYVNPLAENSNLLFGYYVITYHTYFSYLS